MPEPAPNNGDMELTTVAMSLMRQVDERLGRMEGKLDAIAAERREEAKDHGNHNARIYALESWKTEQLAHGERTRQIAWGAILAAICSAIAQHFWK